MRISNIFGNESTKHHILVMNFKHFVCVFSGKVVNLHSENLSLSFWCDKEKHLKSENWD